MLREEATLADYAEQRMAEAAAMESKVFEVRLCVIAFKSGCFFFPGHAIS